MAKWRAHVNAPHFHIFPEKQFFVCTCSLFSDLGLLIVSQMETEDEGSKKYESIVHHFQASSSEMVGQIRHH